MSYPHADTSNNIQRVKFRLHDTMKSHISDKDINLSNLEHRNGKTES